MTLAEQAGGARKRLMFLYARLFIFFFCKVAYYCYHVIIRVNPWLLLGHVSLLVSQLSHFLPLTVCGPIGCSSLASNSITPTKHLWKCLVDLAESWLTSQGAFFELEHALWLKHLGRWWNLVRCHSSACARRYTVSNTRFKRLILWPKHWRRDRCAWRRGCGFSLHRCRFCSKESALWRLLCSTAFRIFSRSTFLAPAKAFRGVNQQTWHCDLTLDCPLRFANRLGRRHPRLLRSFHLFFPLLSMLLHQL